MRETDRRSRMRALPLALSTALAVSGCSSMLPAAGPTTGAVVDGADISTSEGTFARYEIVDLSAATIEALRGRALDSLLASFGDRRPSLEPVIGVGDYVPSRSGKPARAACSPARWWPTASRPAPNPPSSPSRSCPATGPSPFPTRAHPGGRAPPAGRAGPHRDRTRRQGHPAPGAGLGHQIRLADRHRHRRGRGRRPGAAVGQGDRLLDVVATAGGVRAPVNETFVRLSRGERTATVPGPRSSRTRARTSSCARADTLTLVRDPQTFGGGGSGQLHGDPVPGGGGHHARPGAGQGPRPVRLQADPSGTFIFRFEPAAVVRRLKPAARCWARRSCPWSTGSTCATPTACSSPRPSACATRDLVYVSNAPFTEVQKVLSVFSTVTAPVTAGAAVYSRPVGRRAAQWGRPGRVPPLAF